MTTLALGPKLEKEEHAIRNVRRADLMDARGMMFSDADREGIEAAADAFAATLRTALLVDDIPRLPASGAPAAGVVARAWADVRPTGAEVQFNLEPEPPLPPPATRPVAPTPAPTPAWFQMPQQPHGALAPQKTAAFDGPELDLGSGLGGGPSGGLDGGLDGDLGDSRPHNDLAAIHARLAAALTSADDGDGAHSSKRRAAAAVTAARAVAAIDRQGLGAADANLHRAATVAVQNLVPDGPFLAIGRADAPV